MTIRVSHCVILTMLCDLIVEVGCGYVTMLCNLIGEVDCVWLQGRTEQIDGPVIYGKQTSPFYAAAGVVASKNPADWNAADIATLKVISVSSTLRLTNTWYTKQVLEQSSFCGDPVLEHLLHARHPMFVSLRKSALC
jgi:hypothetical protein